MEIEKNVRVKVKDVDEGYKVMVDWTVTKEDLAQLLEIFTSIIKED